VAATTAVKLGVPGYHTLAVPHPVWGKDEEAVRALARPLLDQALRQLGWA
jgi:hypothetical protein